MRLSAPIYRLKRKARLLSRTERIPHHEALNRIARAEGFDSWSLLASRAASGKPGKRLLSRLAPGDLVLLGARPGHGKTLLGLELAVEAMKRGQHGALFSLEFRAAEVAARFADLGEDLLSFAGKFDFDGSDEICADHIVDRLQSAARGTLVVIDYLQLLDQRRTHPDLMEQMTRLKAFAEERGLIMVFISQIDRRYDAAESALPTLAHVRLPNPLDLSLFSKACFLNDGEIELAAVS